jgi:hypothetical protein
MVRPNRLACNLIYADTSFCNHVDASFMPVNCVFNKKLYKRKKIGGKRSI